MSRYQPTKLDWWILASLLVMTLIAACCGCSKAADRSESPAPNPFAIPAAEKSIPSNSTGLDHFADASKMVPAPPAIPAKPSNKDVPPAQRVTPKLDSKPDTQSIKPVPPPQFQPPHDEPRPVPVVPRAPTRITFHLPKEILITGPEHCPACKDSGRALERAKFRVKHDKKRADWNERYGGPVFHFICPNGKWAFLPPSAWADGIQGLIKAIDAKMRENGAVDPVDNEFNEPAADQRVAAAGPGGSIKARAEVVRAFAFLRERVGENVPMQFRWARTGLQTFPVYGAPSNWSIEAICGKYGFVELSAPGCNLPVDHASVKYDVNGNVIGIETRVEFDLPNGTPKAGAKPVGFVDPASLMTIFSVLKGVWAIFHTKVSVDLGGNVEAKAVLVGDVLAVDFSQGPSVRIESLFSFYVAVKRVELTTDKCRVLFSGSRFLKERTFQLN